MHARFLALTLFLVLAQGDRLEAQLGTAFTYQGQLNQEACPQRRCWQQQKLERRDRQIESNRQRLDALEKLQGQ